MADQLQTLRNVPALSRIRRNHALEHATIHILSQQFPNQLIGGENENWRRRAERLPLAIAASLFALIISQPIGLSVQQHITTQGDPEQLEVISIRRVHTSSNPTFHILTKN
jgi:hypothetical protein